MKTPNSKVLVGTPSTPDTVGCTPSPKRYDDCHQQHENNNRISRSSQQHDFPNGRDFRMARRMRRFVSITLASSTIIYFLTCYSPKINNYDELSNNDLNKVSNNSKQIINSWDVNAELVHKMITPGWHVPTKPSYLRNTQEIIARGSNGTCANAIDVLGWIMDEVNKENMTMMIAYGELIHLFREGDFVKKESGHYIDDDIDTFASLKTISFLETLEPELFQQFGWSIKVKKNQKEYVVFMQIMASCGHTPVEEMTKIHDFEPAIEIYPLAHSKPVDGRSVVKDLWMGNTYSESIIYPLQHFDFDSAATNRTLNLQLPNKVSELLFCLYGNWMVPSSKHTRANNKCMDR